MKVGHRVLQVGLMSLVAASALGAEPSLPSLPAVTVVNDSSGGATYSVSLQILAAMTALTLLPAGILMMTAFTRIVVVLAILRQALGTLQTPSNQIIVGLSLFLTFFVMAPVITQVHQTALEPYLDGDLGFLDGLNRARAPVHAFMLHHTRANDLELFASLSHAGEFETPEDVPLTVLVPAFVTSELKTAFQIGFLLFVPFLIIDLVVASILMAMGMMMLSPLIISFPFKLMLFVLVDGWALVTGTLAASFNS